MSDDNVFKQLYNKFLGQNKESDDSDDSEDRLEDQSSLETDTHSPSPRKLRSKGPASTRTDDPNKLIKDLRKHKRTVDKTADALAGVSLSDSELDSTAESTNSSQNTGASSSKGNKRFSQKLVVNLTTPDAPPEIIIMANPVVNNYVSLYVPPVAQSTYDGTSDIKDFLDKYETLAKSHSWPDEVKVANFGLHIDGAVKDFYKLLKASTAASQLVTEDKVVIKWTDLRKAFLAAFKSKTTTEEYERQLTSRKMKDSENVETYYWAILRLCNKVDTAMTETKKVSHLIKGLAPAVAREIYITQPKTVQEIFDHLIQMEKFNSLMGKTVKPAVAHSNDAAINALVSKIDKLRFGQNKSPQQGSNFKRGSFSRPFRGNSNYQSTERYGKQNYQNFRGNSNRSRGNFRGNSRGRGSFGKPNQGSQKPYNQNPGGTLALEGPKPSGSQNKPGSANNNFSNPKKFNKDHTTSGQPICAYCKRVGHRIFTCPSRQGNL